ncbi:BTAD domain-containing putative transcriptional regulator [Longimicrobium sp.]|uniref:BTAD domain-containing putative transcriptional regulator n=1 Tax=Longimicrobium sp. TaxID=2029185 RepID=UPI002E305D9E|nr:BTAD domain-containing putative transcriptional regulator [Longimicrobium sp.]HEX6038078.1 BTAD domain-containing putative transcriptional regulator [Longimicrobium sp.]
MFIKLLGDPLLRGPDGRPVTGRAAYKRRLALLSILGVARGRPVGRERLIGLLWPDHPTDAARHTLSESLYVLRKELGEGLFVSVGDEVALNPAAAASDVDAFETALEAGRPEEAVRAFGGPLLDGFYVSNALDFERWLDGERDRLARACASALEGLAAAAEAEGRPLGAVEWWRRLAAHDPYSSRAALRLASALEAAGERGAALRAATAHAARLREELGVEADPELAELVERLLAEPARIPPPPVLPASVPTAGAEPETKIEESSGAETASDAGGGQGIKAAVPADAPGGGELAADAGAPVPQPEPVSSAPGSAVDAVPSQADHPEAADARRPPRWSRAAAALTGALAMVSVLAGLALSGGAPRAPEQPRYDPRRIAVLYFDDHSPNGELAYLASGLTEMLIHELSQVQVLDVVSRNGVKPYRERAVPFDSMAADLRAGSVVEGSVQRSGNRVRVTVQLIDANSNAHLESRTVERPMADLFVLQDAVAREVSGFLRRRVGREVRLVEMERRAGNPRALELVLRAVDARARAREMARSPHPRDVAAALQVLAGADSLLLRAAALDGKWGEPELQRGWVTLDRAWLVGGVEKGPAAARALRHADAVLRQDPGSLDARELRGTALWRLAGANPRSPRERGWRAEAERELRAVVAADPDRASAWITLSQLLRLGGGLAEAEVAARRAREADAYLAVDEVGVDRLYRAAFAFEDFGAARHWCVEGRRGYPADYRFWECELAILARDPDAPAAPDSAWRLVAALDRVDPPARAAAAGRGYSPVFRRMMAAAVLARAGHGDSARAVAARARREVQGDPARRASFLWDQAYLWLLLSERARSAAALDTFVAARPALREYVARERVFREAGLQ